MASLGIPENHDEQKKINEQYLKDFYNKGPGDGVCVHAGSFSPLTQSFHLKRSDKFMFDFGVALAAMKSGQKVCRNGWNGKGMWLELSDYGEGAMYKGRPLHPHILMATAQGDYVPWLASQTDMLSSDWMLLLEKKEVKFNVEGNTNDIVRYSDKPILERGTTDPTLGREAY